MREVRSQSFKSLPPNLAIRLLVQGAEVHTFCANAAFFAGADIPRDEIQKDIEEAGGAKLVLGDHRMASMGHNLLFKSRRGLLFAEVDPLVMASHLTD